MSRPRLKPHAFTLVEVLIAVGAVSLIAIGLAKVFSSTGETVRAGRRLSNFNEYAALIERQIRDDVAAMTRDGFMVIRNRNTADGNSVVNIRLDPDQAAAFARPRRVDELMFFANGRYSTLRDPIHPSRVPTGNAARIYYGHGLRNVNPAAPVPEPLRQHSGFAQTQSSFGASGGPNEFASDWILLRHVTTLIDQLATAQSPLAGTVAGVTTGEIADNAIQVSLQPAASSIFQILALTGPQPLPTDAQLVRDEPVVAPMFSSGIVDLAVTSLSEIRNFVLDAQEYPATTNPWDPDADAASDGVGNRYAFQRDANPTQITNGPGFTTSNMKRWIIGALPSGWNNPFDLRSDRRMRCELSPPNLLGTVNGGAGWANNEPWKRVDQMMLAASNFVPHCTEFIVEWSFGKPGTDIGNPDFSQVQWYGLERQADPLEPASPVVARPYNRIDNRDTVNQLVPMRNGQTLVRPVNPAVVHFPPITNAGSFPPDYGAFYSCFGYLDPTYPEVANYETDPDQRFPSTIPWAWPKLLRITISLVDPTDRLREQTFQFIIEVPEAKRDRF